MANLHCHNFIEKILQKYKSEWMWFKEDKVLFTQFKQSVKKH